MIGQTTSDAAPTTPAETPATAPADTVEERAGKVTRPPAAEEFGGRDGPDPTRYGDWEKNGRCVDF